MLRSSYVSIPCIASSYVQRVCVVLARVFYVHPTLAQPIRRKCNTCRYLLLWLRLASYGLWYFLELARCVHHLVAYYVIIACGLYTRSSRGPLTTPKILYKIVQCLKFREDCKFVIILYVTRA